MSRYQTQVPEEKHNNNSLFYKTMYRTLNSTGHQ